VRHLNEWSPSPASGSFMSAEHGADVYDLIAFQHWDFLDKQGRTSIGVR
jgi:hypothetical protein